jgi:diguanylate cyclase (GGDEF)-like protein
MKKKIGQSKIHQLFGKHYYHANDFPKAIDSYQNALLTFDGSNNYALKADIYNKLGNAYRQNNQKIQALLQYQKAKKLLEENGSEKDLMNTKFNIGNLYAHFADYDMALKLFEDVLSEQQKSKDKLGAYATMVSLSNVYFATGKLIKAEKMLLKLLNLEGSMHGYIELRLADIYQSLDKPKTAIEYAKICADSNIPFFVIPCENILASSNFSLGKIEKANLHLNRSIFASRSNNPTINVDSEALIISALISANQGNTAKSYSDYLLYVSAKRKVSKQSLLNLLKETIELNKKENELEVSKRYIQQLKQKEELAKLQVEQEKLFYGYIITTLVFSFIIILFIYRYNSERKSKRTLERKVDERTFELQEAKNELLKLSLSDGLTSVYNRRCFDKDIEKIWHETTREKSYFLLLIADIDYFKLFNDEYGHLAGDEALVKVANVLDQFTRTEDRVYRYGGEEFVIIFRNHDSISANNTMTRVLSEIRNLKIEHTRSEHRVVTISAGMCRSDEGATTIKEIINLADQRLYSAKESGRNCLLDTQIQ